MDIGFSEEQELLRDTARKFLDCDCTTKFVRQMMATEEAVTPEFWPQLAEQGWLGITYRRRGRRQRARPHRSRRADGGDGPRGDARPLSRRRCCSAARRSREAGSPAQRQE